MIRTYFFPIVLVFIANWSSALPLAESQDPVKNCAQLLESLRALTPPSLRAEITRRHNPIVPWVGIIKEEIEPGQGLDSIAAQGIAARLEEMQMLLLQLRDVGRRLPSGLRRSLAETLTRATSAYFSSLNIPHSVERFSSVLGQKHWRIKVAAQAGSVIPIVEMANRLAASDVSLQFDFNWQLAGKGAAAFVASQRITNPAFGGGPLRPVHSLFTNQFTDEARLVLPLRLAYLPEAIKASVGVLHELRHLENSLRRLRHEDFPFYGEAFFPLGLNQFFESDSEKTSLFAKIYGRFFSLEENDTITENFFYLRDILDDPLAIFNRELDEGFMESEFKVDIQNLTLANKVSKAIGESVMSVIAKPDSAKTIQFIERDGIVWGKVISTLTPGKMKTTFILSVPLVAALPQQSRADHLEALRKQMEFMLVNLQNRAVFVEWLNSLDQLRNSEEFKGVSFKDFLRNQFLLSPDKNGLTSASSGPQEVASPALMNVINGSTVTALEHVDQILQGIGQPIGYSNMATWMESNRGQVRPVMYVVLYAEALVAKKSITEVENQFPEARGMAQYLITHMESAHANLMSRFMFRFSTF